MRWPVVLGLMLWSAAGCISNRPWDPAAPPVPIFSDNPALIPLGDPGRVWEAVVAVVETHFKIKEEEPVRVFGSTLTEGRLETYPEVGSTVLEPWRHDSADAYEKLESTLQSIRRYARVRVSPVCSAASSLSGIKVEVTVFKELEDVARPAHASAGSATFQPESSLVRVVGPAGEEEVHKNWIALGRDQALEQRILMELQDRLGVANQPLTATVVPVASPAVIPTWPQPVPAQTVPSQPAAPAASPGCRVGANHQDRGVQEHQVYRVDVTEYLEQPDDRVQLVSETAAPTNYGYMGSLPADPAGEPSQTPPTSSDYPPVGGGVDSLSYPPENPRGRLEEANSDRENQTWSDAYRTETRHFVSDVIEDYRQFYSARSLLLLGGGIGTAAVLANTSMDQHFQNWHDRNVYSHDLSCFAYVAREFGNGNYMVPLFAFCALTRPAYEPGSPNWFSAEWGNRSMRSFLVGAPALGALQSILGAGRPDHPLPNSSHWTPFQNAHGASGHAFIGGVAFLNAAMLTDDTTLKAMFFAASTLPGYARIVQDKHYLSQVLLGWSLAYLSASAVDRTDRSMSNWMLTPVVMEEGVGVGFLGTW